MSYAIMGFGVIAILVGIRILIWPSFGKRFFGDWATLKLDIIRLTVSIVVLASSWNSRPNLLFIAGCILAAATLFFAVMGRWKTGHKFVQKYLVNSELGARIYVSCVIIPMGILIVIGTLNSYSRIPKARRTC